MGDNIYDNIIVDIQLPVTIYSDFCIIHLSQSHLVFRDMNEKHKNDLIVFCPNRISRNAQGSPLLTRVNIDIKMAVI